ncbi:MAG: hypothetical protein IT324_07300 [Anaerolineae bacterium]|nr:hypothetical protein [Anaerolineae bacterium]
MSESLLSHTLMPVTASPCIEQLSPHLTREWLYDGRIVVYAFNSSDRDTVALWAETCKADILACPPDKPFLVLHDFSAKGIMVSPYGRDRAEELAHFHPEVKGRAAVLLPPTIASHLIRLFMVQKPHTCRQRKMFESRGAAIKWLLEYGPENS